MGIQRQRRQSLRTGKFGKLEEVHCHFLQQCYIQRYTHSSTQGKLTLQKPLLSVMRWLRQPKETLRSFCIKNMGAFV
jgi:hypothetical protein